jgi:hypothetical protein
MVFDRYDPLAIEQVVVGFKGFEIWVSGSKKLFVGHHKQPQTIGAKQDIPAVHAKKTSQFFVGVGVLFQCLVPLCDGQRLRLPSRGGQNGRTVKVTTVGAVAIGLSYWSAFDSVRDRLTVLMHDIGEHRHF